jgi:hypothetical protein
MTTTIARRTHLCEPWQVSQGEVEHIGAAYLHMYGQLKDAFVLASDAECLLLDLAPDLIEIEEALVEEKKPLPAGVWTNWRTRGWLVQCLGHIGGNHA